jgi:hypothetical protein
MSSKRHKISVLGVIIAGVITGGLVYFARGPYKAIETIHQLLTENNELKQAITNLTEEDQIGYAKIISQQYNDGKLVTTIKFVETARNDKLKTILEKEYTIEGDVFHFDALVVKFGNKMVMDGRAKALYLWRRVYGEKMAPGEGFLIEEPGSEPQRYKDLLEALPIKTRELFWTNIWELANDKNKLTEYGIDAIYGNAIYSMLQKNLIYIFKITPAGQIFYETVPDL